MLEIALSGLFLVLRYVCVICLASSFLLVFVYAFIILVCIVVCKEMYCIQGVPCDYNCHVFFLYLY